MQDCFLLQYRSDINLIVGMSTACFFPNLGCEQAVTKIGELGISNAEVFFSTLSEYRPKFAKEVKKRADEYSTNINSVHAYSLQFEPQLFSRYERSRQDALDIYEQVLSAGAELGAKVYVMHGPAHVKRACKLNLNYEYIAKRVLPLCELANNYGIKLTWENVHWCWYAEPLFPEKLQKHLGDTNLYYTLDVKQAAQSGFEPIEYINHTADRLQNVHMCDYIKTHDRGIVPVLPFNGEMNFDSLKQALADIGYSGAMMLEVYSDNYSSYDELKQTYCQVKSMF